MPFDYEGAKEAGFTDQQIAEHLAPRNDFDLSGAVAAGFGYEKILPHLLEKEGTSTPETTALGQVGETLKAIPRGFARSLLTAGEGAAELADAVTNKVGLENLIDSGDDNALVAAARQGQKALNESWLGVDDAYQDAWMTKFGEGLGSMASFLTPGGALKLAGIGSRAAQLGATATLAAPIGAGEQVQRVEQARAEGIDVSEAQEDASVLFGAAIGLTELAPVDRLLRGLDPSKLSDDLKINIMQRLASAMGSGGVEALQETSASLMQDLAEREIYNPDLQLGQEAWDSFTIGGAVGFTADLVLNAMGARRNTTLKKSQEADELQKRNEEEERRETVRRQYESVESLRGGRPVEETVVEEVDAATIEPETEDMGRYGRNIARRLGQNFPTDTSFTVEPVDVPLTPEELAAETPQYGPDAGQPMATVKPAFQVYDSTGQAYGTPRLEYEESAVLAGTLNKQIIDQSTRNTVTETIQNTPEQYDAPTSESLDVIGNRIKNPRANEITADTLNFAAETTIDKGFDEALSADEAMQRNMGRVFTEQEMVNSLTASQRVNRKRLAKGMPETSTFTVEEAKDVLGDDFGRLGDVGAGGIVETQTYEVSQDKKGNPIVVSSAGEVITTNKIERLRKKDGKPYTQTRKIKTVEQAQRLAERLNSRYNSTVDEVVFEDIKAGNAELKSLLERKNIPDDLESPAIKTMAKAFVGKENVNDMSAGEKKFFYQKIRKLPVVPSPLAEGLPDFNQTTTLTEDTTVTEEPLALPAPDAELASPELVADMQERLDAELKRKNLTDKGVTGKIFQQYREYGLNQAGEPVFSSEVIEDAEGAYLADFNQIAFGIQQAIAGTDVDMNDPDAVFAAIKDILNHETVHALRTLDLFTAEEYQVLERAAENTKRKGEDITYLKYAEANYSDLNKTQQMEEAIAELVRQNTTLGGRPRTIINKIKNILGAIARWITGSSPSVQRIVENIESGKVGGREAGKIRTLRATRKEQDVYEREDLKAPEKAGRVRMGDTLEELEAQQAEENHWAAKPEVSHSKRKTPPKKTQKAYKLFRAKPSKENEYFPLFVLADKSVPVGEWVSAKSGKRTKGGGVKSGIGELAYRPGWHAGDYASADHIGGKSRGTGEVDYRKADQIWVEIEMADDVDWQTVADQRARSMANGQPDLTTAHITDQIPKDGFYRYKTNPNMTGNWLIGGDMKVNRVLAPQEVKDIGAESGMPDLPLLPELIEQEGLAWNDLAGVAKTELKRFYPDVHARMAPESAQRKRPATPTWFQNQEISYSRRARNEDGKPSGLNIGRGYPTLEETFQLSPETSSIAGIKELGQKAAKGDADAAKLLQDVATIHLEELLEGTGGTITRSSSGTGMYRGVPEVSIQPVIKFPINRKVDVLNAIHQFSVNFDQEEIHARVRTNRPIGHKYQDGSYATPMYRWTLAKPVEKEVLQRVVDNSGIEGLTLSDRSIEIYYSGDVSNEQRLAEFAQGAERINEILGEKVLRLRRETQRLWPYGRGGKDDGTIGFGRLRSNLPSQDKQEVSRVVARVGKYLSDRGKVNPYAAQDIDAEQRRLQQEIALAFEKLPANDMDNPLTRQAYEELAEEVAAQFASLPVRVEVFTGRGEPYANSAEMREDVRKRNHLYIYKTTPDTYGPEGQDFSSHPLLQPTPFTDINGEPLLYNDLFRAVHDYLAHNLSPVQFGPKGEEAAWKNHMAVTNSPFARWALTSETRGQNSWVNFRPDLDPATPPRDRPFAEQKSALLPLKYSLVGDASVDAPVLELIDRLSPTQTAGSAGTLDDSISYSRRGVVSTRFPTAKGREIDPAEELVVNQYQDYLDGPTFAKNMGVINSYDELLGSGTDLEQAQKFVEHVKNNLLFVYDSIDPQIRERSAKWYEGANKLMQELADKHGLTLEQTAAVAANLSPQKDWYMNASLAERVVDIYQESINESFTPEMEAKGVELFTAPLAARTPYKIKNRQKNIERLERIKGKSLADLVAEEAELLDQAMWIRIYDQTYNNPSYQILSPEGEYVGAALNQDGTPSKSGWGSLNEIAKGLIALQDGSLSSISSSLGDANKVRNFYNNIYDPHAEEGFVTIDTHAVAAGLLRPLGGSAPQVAANFGTLKGVGNSAVTGHKGVYSLYEEAYRRAAEERNILPREMQSITWEGIRGLFSPEYKQAKANQAFANNIWKQYNNRSITLDKVREEILSHADQFSDPEWARSSYGNVEVGRTSGYERKLSDAGVSRLGREGAGSRGRVDATGRPATPELVEPRSIPASELEAAAEQNLEALENTTGGAVPTFSVKASPEAQAVARNPDLGAKPTAEQEIFYSRRRPSDPEVRAAVDKTVQPDYGNKGILHNLLSFMSPSSKDEYKSAFSRFRQGYINRYEPLEKMDNMIREKLGTLADSSAFFAMIMGDRASNQTAGSIKHGVTGYDSKAGIFKVKDFVYQGKKVDGLLGVLKPLMASENVYGEPLLEVFQGYAIAKRAKEINDSGKLSPVPKGEEAAYLAEMEAMAAKYINPETGQSYITEVYDMYQAYNNEVIKLMKNSGLITDAEARSWERSSVYYPFYKDFDADPNSETNQETSDGKLVNVDSILNVGMENSPSFLPQEKIGSKKLRRLEGSRLRIDVPPLEAMVKNLDAAINMSMKNIAYQRAMRDAVYLGFASKIEKGRKMKALKKGEISNSVYIREKGRDVHYKVHDQLLFAALTPIADGSLVSNITMVTSIPARFLRESITRSPGFMGVNMLRDTMSAFVTSGAKFIPIVDTVKKFKMSTDQFEEFERLGIVTGYDNLGDPKDLAAYMEKQLRKKGVDTGASRGKKAWENSLGKAWDILGAGTTRSDFATRSSVYDDTLARTNNQAEAMFQAIEVLNFGRRGGNAAYRMIAAATPFLNARIQGLDVLWRTGLGTYSSRSDLGKAQIQRNAFLRASYLTALTAAYWMLVSDDDQYKEASDYVKDNNWLIPNPFGTQPIKIPIPFEIGLLFKTFPEKALDATFKDATARDFEQTVERGVLSTLEMNPLGMFQITAPIVEIGVNKNFYTGRQIVPYYIDQDIVAGLQDTLTTSQFAEWLGQSTGMSPMKIDHVLNGYAGSLGSLFLDTIDMVLRTPSITGDFSDAMPSMSLSEHPATRRFFARAEGTGLSEDFYEMNRYVQQVVQTLGKLEREGRIEEYQKFLYGREHLVDLEKDFNSIRQDLSDLRKEKQEIIRMDIDPDVKREQVDEIDRMVNEMLQIVPELKEMVKLPLFGQLPFVGEDTFRTP